MKLFINKFIFICLILISLNLNIFSLMTELDHDTILSSLILELYQNIKLLDQNSPKSYEFENLFQKLNTEGKSELENNLNNIQTYSQYLNNLDGPMHIVNKIKNIANSLKLIYTHQSYLDNMKTLARTTARPFDISYEPHFIKINKPNFPGNIIKKDGIFSITNENSSTDFHTFIEILKTQKSNIENIKDKNINLYSREYSIQQEILPGDFLSDKTRSFLNFKKGDKIFFSTLNKNRFENIENKFENIIPVNSSIIDKLNEGDVISFNSKMAILTSSSSSFGGGVSYSPETYYVIYNSFKIIIKKLSDNQIELLLLLNDDKINLIMLKYSISNNNFNEPAVKELTESDIDLKNFSINYKFDFSDEQARQAFNNILNPDLKFKRKIYNNFISRFNLDNLLISNLITTENIFQKQRGILPEFRTIDRLYTSLICEKNYSNFQLDNTINENGNLIFEFTKSGNDKRSKQSIFVQKSDIANVNTLDSSRQLYLLSDLNISRNNYINFETFMLLIDESYPRLNIKDFDFLKNQYANITGNLFDQSFLLKIRIAGNEIRNFKYKILIDYSKTINNITDSNNVNQEKVFKALFNSIESLHKFFVTSPEDVRLYDDIDISKFGTDQLALYGYFKNKQIKFSIWDNINKFGIYFFNLSKDNNALSKNRKLQLLLRNSFFSNLIPRFLIELSTINGISESIKFYEDFSGLGVFKFSNIPETVRWYLYIF